eukprot:jgi/Hompol1/1451/HPOL_000957-RA
MREGGIHDNSIFSANLYLAEDRILCFELITKKNSRWILHYVSKAHADTDVPDSIPEFLSQRRRWLNGSLFASFYAMTNIGRIWGTKHGFLRKLVFSVQHVYNVINQIFSFFIIGNFAISFFYLLEELSLMLNNPGSSVDGVAAKIITVIMNIARYSYPVVLVCLFIIAFGNRPQAFKSFYTVIMIMFGVIGGGMITILVRRMMILFQTHMSFTAPDSSFHPVFASLNNAANVSTNDTAQLIVNTIIMQANRVIEQQLYNSLDASRTEAILFLSAVASTIGVFFVASAIQFDIAHMFTCFVQYLLLLPSYINVLTVYALANLHDVSWGTKGSDKAESLPQLNVRKLSDGTVAADVAVTADKTDLSRDYERALETLRRATAERAIAPHAKPVSVDAKTQQEDDYKAFRTGLMLSYIASNAALFVVAVSISSSKFVLGQLAAISILSSVKVIGVIIFVFLKFWNESIKCFDPRGRWLKRNRNDEMKLALGVCRRWKLVISDDHCWKAAFSSYFGSIPIRRLKSNSWRLEYLARIRLDRDWTKSKQGVQFEPRIGRIHDIFIDQTDGRMHAGSLQKGMVAFCHPATGKVDRNFVFCSGTDAPMEISSLKMDKLRIAIGYLTGHVALVTGFRDKSSHTVRRFTGFHNGPVTCINWLPNVIGVIVSGSADGNVRIWSVSSESCVRVLAGNGAVITHLSMDHRDHVIACTSTGSCLVWDIDLVDFIPNSTGSTRAIASQQSQTASESPQSTLEPQRFSREIKCASMPIMAMIYDASCFCVAIAARRTEPLLSDHGSGPMSSLSIWSVTLGVELIRFNLDTTAIGLTAINWDRPSKGPAEAGVSLLASGNESGSIKLWKVPAIKVPSAKVPHTEISCVTITPMRTITSIHLSPITQLWLDEHKLISASSDGKIKIFDVLTGSLIRNLSIKLGRSPWPEIEPNDAERNAIHCLWASELSLVACAGASVKFWSFDHAVQATPGSSAKKKKGSRTILRSGAGGSGGGSGSGSGAGGRGNRHSASQAEHLFDLDSDVREIRREIDMERTELLFQRNQHDLFNGAGINRTNMTDEELLNYAMMLSNEQLELDEARRSGAMDTLSSTPTGTALATNGASSIDSLPVRRGSSQGGSSSHGSWQNQSRYMRQQYRDEWEDDDDERVDPESAMYLSPRGAGIGGTNELQLNMDELDLSGGSHGSRGRRVTIAGSTAGGGGGASRGSRGGDDEHTGRSANAVAEMIMRRSPRIVPISPGMHPTYRGAQRQPTGNIVVAHRPGQQDEDEELQYVLELSLQEK